MKDYQEVIVKFVKIVEKYPELYNPSHASYGTRRAELAWDKIAEYVTTELNEQCTVEELKKKWKGIRSSFTRFKNKLRRKKSESSPGPIKTYYLYEKLKFLEPFTQIKLKSLEENSKEGRSTFEESGNSDEDNTHDEFAQEAMDSWEVTVKSEFDEECKDTLSVKDVLDVAFEEINPINVDVPNTEVTFDKAKKRKYDDSDDNNDNEDIHFFKSILPDIKDFSVKEKRKLKMGILKLIDEIEDSRVQRNPDHDVSSSKLKRQA